MLRGNQIEIIKMCGGIDFEMLFVSCCDVQANMLNSEVWVSFTIFCAWGIVTRFFIHLRPVLLKEKIFRL